MKALTHFDARGNARMVDVSGKEMTARIAIAKGAVLMRPDTLKTIIAGGVKKGDVVGVARLAGIMAAKRTSELIPLCHPLPLSSLTVDLAPDPKRPAIEITATVKLVGRTGVEMEALTAVSIAALTVYDMCKSLDRSMTMTEIRLIHKSGGKSGTYKRK
ncbi:MAG: cyclic pyranopterin monophosphate synthase MoaC [Pseudomonadota bacterium]